MTKSISMLLAGIVITASVGWAQPALEKRLPPHPFPGMMLRMGGPGAGPGDRMVDVLTEFLDLTEKQQASWKEDRTQTEKTIESIAKELRQAHESIRTKLEADGAVPAEIGQLMIDAHSLEVQIRAAEEAGRDSFIALLTSEQRAKHEVFEEVMELIRPEPGPGVSPQPLH